MPTSSTKAGSGVGEGVVVCANPNPVRPTVNDWHASETPGGASVCDNAERTGTSLATMPPGGLIRRVAQLTDDRIECRRR